MELFKFIFTLFCSLLIINETKACVIPGIQLAVGRSYQFKTPFYPFPYRNYEICYWTANSPPNTNIHMTCDHFHINPLQHCAYSALYVSKSGDPNLRDAKYYCGYGTLQLTTSANRFSALFKSNFPYYQSYPGFNCRLTANKINVDPTVSTTPSTVSTTKPPTDGKCSCGLKGSSRIVNGKET